MSAKAKVFDNIRKYTTERAPQPDISSFRAVQYPDKVEQFMKIIVAVGGHVVEINSETNLGNLLRELYPDATRFISTLDLGDLTAIRPEDAGDAIAMNGTDVTVLETPLGVCENGCCWVEQREEWRAHLFISENLVFVLDRQNLVHNMHEAMVEVRKFNPSTPFSGFISGPSKTADIEQSLVMGAHGAKGLTVLLR